MIVSFFIKMLGNGWAMIPCERNS